VPPDAHSCGSLKDHYRETRLRLGMIRFPHERVIGLSLKCHCWPCSRCRQQPFARGMRCQARKWAGKTTMGREPPFHGLVTSGADIWWRLSIGATRSPATASLWSLNGGSSLTEAYAHAGAYRNIAAGAGEFEDHEPIGGSGDRQMGAVYRDCGSAN